MGSSVMPPLPTGVVKAQVKRMAGLDFFPSEPEAVRSLVDVLATRCANEQHVKAAVDRWLAEHAQTPKPVEMLAVIDSTRPTTANPPERTCQDCGGSGWLTVKRRVQKGQWDYEADFAEPCSCRGMVSPSTTQAPANAPSERQGQWRPVLGGGAA